MTDRIRGLVLGLSLAVYAAGAYLFYVTYVPLVGPFQTAFLPVLAAVLLVTVIDARKGTILFIALFPLINGLPYFFRLYEPLPMAPAALVLFLFFFGGWLGSLLFRGPKPSPNAPLFKPLVLFAALAALSGLVAFWRYANFAPFRSDHIYELITNAHGVSAGGALMSVVFCTLNYLTGIAFLFVACGAFKARKDPAPVLAAVLIGAYASVSFGLFQHFGHLSLGNNPASLRQGLLNGTFKDALSFGTYLAMVIPLLLGIALARRGLMRVLAFATLLSAAYVLFFTGSKSGLLGLPVSLGVFALMNVRAGRPAGGKSGARSWKNVHWSSWAVVLVILALVANGVIFRKSLLEKAATSRTSFRLKGAFRQESMTGVLRGRADVLWKLALPMIRDYPLTGLGTGSFIIEVSNYAKSHGITKRVPESAENYLLQVATETGLIGVALILWAIWELVKQMRRSVSASPPASGNRWIVTGAVAGIVSYLLTLQVHTYIGSFEIKYFFWLLVAIVLAAGRTPSVPGDPAVPKGPSKARFRQLAVAGLVLYGAVLLWNSTRSLSLESRTREFGLRQDFGFSRMEKTLDGRAFRWTGRHSGTALRVDKPSVLIPLQAAHPDIGRDPVKVRLFAVRDLFRHKRLIGEAVLRDAEWKTFEYSLAPELGQDIILLVEVGRTWNPWKTRKIRDARDLGVAVGEIAFR
jgi:hypothetical protein